jgi:hypothetical protein
MGFMDNAACKNCCLEKESSCHMLVTAQFWSGMDCSSAWVEPIDVDMASDTHVLAVAFRMGPFGGTKVELEAYNGSSTGLSA